MQVPLPKTDLNDRILWHDGDSTVSFEYVTDIIIKGGSVNGLFVSDLSKDIEQYNSLVEPDQHIKVKTDLKDVSFNFNIPTKYKELNVSEYVAEMFKKECDSITFAAPVRDDRIIRINEELKLYESLGLVDVLRTLIYIINTLSDNNIVWGVGRGSSVSSYVLYLIGVHDVDSVEYDLDMKDFLRSE